MREYNLKNTALYGIAVLAMAIMFGCAMENNAKETAVMSSISEVPPSAWNKLSQKKVYFGHQSVGNNIIAGIKDIMIDNSAVSLNIAKTDDPESFAVPMLAHSEIGNNGDPNSKISAFNKVMDGGVGNKADIAFLKLCFWDVRSQTDVAKVFDLYKDTFVALKARYPKTIFVHMTVPLMSHKNSVKKRLKILLSIPDSSDLDNISRNKLNDLILKEYTGKEPVFDIALTESTRPDGTRTFFKRNDEKYYYLAPEYTHDGGHLNEVGRRNAAAQLLITLAHLAESGTTGRH